MERGSLSEKGGYQQFGGDTAGIAPSISKRQWQREIIITSCQSGKYAQTIIFFGVSLQADSKRRAHVEKI